MYAKQLIMISSKKTSYLKQLIYTKQLIRIFFLKKKNNLFETTYLCKTTYYDLILKNNLPKRA